MAAQDTAGHRGREDTFASFAIRTTMAMPFRRRLPLLLAVAIVGCCSPPPSAAEVAFGEWSPDVFAAAKQQGKLVLLDLGTGWCHWCHVMEQTTYRDPAVRAELLLHYLPLRADADARLDLAARYQDYGWPATIVFDGSGRELWKHRGYVPPVPMAEVLARLARDPQPLAAEPEPPAAGGSGLLAEPVRAQLVARQISFYDRERGGWGSVHKYLDVDALEWLLLSARNGDAGARQRLEQTLAAELKLIDPVWGGAFQYSDSGDWDHPHFEKIMSRQFADLRGYALAYGAFGDAANLEAAQAVRRYLQTFLRGPDGAFYASQDADVKQGEHSAEYFARDDQGRRGLGMPVIDQNVYARENGQAIQGLCSLFAASGDAAVLADAVAAARAVLAQRRRADGTFAHGASELPGGPYLADSLAMGSALLQLWEVTGERSWLDAAVRTAHALAAAFAPRAAGTGYGSNRGDGGPLPPVVDKGENVALARFGNRLFHCSGDAPALALAEAAMAFATRPDVALQGGLPADLLLADLELRTEPQHVLVVGRRSDPAARALFAEALAAAAPYRRIDFVDPQGEPPVRDDVVPPPVSSAAAFVCANGACSAAITTPVLLRGKLLR